MIVDLAVAEQREQPFDFFIVDSAPESDAVNVVDRHEHCRFVGDHSQMIKAASCSQDGFGFDALNDAESVVWVNDLVTDLECHASLTSEGVWVGIAPGEPSFQYSRKWPENRHFLHILAKFAVQRELALRSGAIARYRQLGNLPDELGI